MVAKLEVTACDEESTVPITLSAWIVPFIKEPPLPITICPLVNPLNVTWTVLLSIAKIDAGRIISSCEPVP